MNCPQCQTRVNEPCKHCMQCGFTFEDHTLQAMAVYFEMERQFLELRKVENTLHSTIDVATTKLKRFDELIDKQIRTTSFEKPRPETAAPPEAKPVMVSPPSQLIGPAAPIMPGPPLQAKTPPRAAASPRGDFETRFGQRWVLIIGIIVMVFAVGYFLKYSFSQGWIGPAGRVALCYLWGVVLMVAGDRFRKRNFTVFGLCLVGGGIAVLYFSAFSAFQVYNLIGQTLSFAVMVLITVLSVFLSIHYDNRWLAALGLTGGFLTPILLSTGVDNQLALMSYMTILNLGLLAVAYYKKWGVINILGFLFTYFIFTCWYFTHYQTEKFWPAVLFLNVFFIIYAIIPIIYRFFQAGGSYALDMVILALNSFIAFGFSWAMIEGKFSLPWVSVPTIFYALVFLSLATCLSYYKDKTREAYVILLSKSALFLVITIPIIFSKNWITIFWAAQAGIFLWMASRLGKKLLAIGAFILMGLALMKFLFYDYFAVFDFDLDGFAFHPNFTDLLAERWITTGMVLLMLLGFSLLLRRMAENEPAMILWKVLRVMNAIGLGLALFYILNIETAAYFHDYLAKARFAAISVLWTFFSMGLVALGFRSNALVYRTLAFGLFFIAILKVFFIDMANVETPYRIVSFFILGMVLIGVSYLYYKYRDRIGKPADVEKKEQGE